MSEATGAQLAENVRKGIVIKTNGGKDAVNALPNMTVKEALNQAGVRLGRGARLFVNGSSAELNTPVKDGDTIVIAPRVSNG